MSPAPLIVVVQHQDDCPPARVGRWLQQAGARLQVVRPDLGGDLPAPDAMQGLLILGGIMGATDDTVAPWLPQVRALIRDAAGAGTPILGICLGHQLIAVALGGRVCPNPNGKQRGLTPIGYTEAIGDDPLFSGAVSGARGVHSNNDVVSAPPPGTLPLAFAPGGELQAARFAPGVWGVQWHPEVDAEAFATWCAGDPPGDEQLARDLIAEVEAADDELAATWRPLAVRFEALCRATTGTAAPPS